MEKNKEMRIRKKNAFFSNEIAGEKFFIFQFVRSLFAIVITMSQSNNVDSWNVFDIALYRNFRTKWNENHVICWCLFRAVI